MRLGGASFFVHGLLPSVAGLRLVRLYIHESLLLGVGRHLHSHCTHPRCSEGPHARTRRASLVYAAKQSSSCKQKRQEAGGRSSL